MSTQRRVLVTGSRKWPHRDMVYAALYRQYTEHGPFVVVHGACSRGADAMASDWVRQHGTSRGVIEERWPAQWNLSGHNAGPRRNILVASVPIGSLPSSLTTPGASFTARYAASQGIPHINFPRPSWCLPSGRPGMINTPGGSGTGRIWFAVAICCQETRGT